MKKPPTYVEFIRCVVRGDVAAVARCVAQQPGFATSGAKVGATRQQAAEFFFEEIAHYLYAGDTALHMAAAAFCRPVAKLLVEHGAEVRARNRRGAEPLHYAADAHRSESAAQLQTIEYLLAIGADPDALDKSGVTPLHRAVRTRSAAAVQALLDGGADARKPNGSGSTPLHLAVQTTGASGSGGAAARDEQVRIVKLLLDHGARVTDADGRGTPVLDAARDPRIRALLD